MADKPKLSVFTRTEAIHPTDAPADNSDLDKGVIKPISVGLPEGERDALDAIAGEMEVTRNQVMRFAIRDFILRYRAGTLDLGEHIDQPPPPKKSLRLPK